MNSKVCVILASNVKEVVLTGLMYASNAKKNNWVEDVKVVFFGPSEKLLAGDRDIQKAVQELSDAEDCFACKAIADRDGISSFIAQLGIEVSYVGSQISDYLKEGYIPMVW